MTLRVYSVDRNGVVAWERPEVRVMTAHGAKGLEAPIVFLPETTSQQSPRGSPLRNLLQSRSWRYTAPLRCLLGLLRRQRAD